MAMVSMDIPIIMETSQPVRAGADAVRMHRENRGNDEANKSLGPLLLTYILTKVLPHEVPIIFQYSTKCSNT